MSRLTTALFSLGVVGFGHASPAVLKQSPKGQLEGPLHFNEDGPFHISVIQDTHMGDGMARLPRLNPQSW